MIWFPSSPAIDAAALVVGVCSLIIGACAFAVTVLLWMLQWHQPAPRHRSTRVAAAARGGIVVTTVITAAALGGGLALVVTASSTVPPTAAPASPAVVEPRPGEATDPSADPSSEASADPSAVPDATDGSEGLVDLGQAQAASRLVQVTEATVPPGAAEGDQPLPTLDGLCHQLGRSSAAWLPGQVEAWDGTQETKAVLTPRKILAPGAAYTWSCTRGGEKLTQAEINYNCATYYGTGYLAAVIDPDNAYTWVCRPHF